LGMNPLRADFPMPIPIMAGPRPGLHDVSLCREDCPRLPVPALRSTVPLRSILHFVFFISHFS
jgi:hypothetical protein